MGRAVGIALEGDGRHGDHRSVGEASLQLKVFALRRRPADPPAIVVDHDRDVIRIIERCCAAVEGRLIEIPLR